MRPVLVIPVRAEFGNGNLPRLLTALARGRRPAAVVLVVNNTAAERWYEADAWVDNRRLLDFVTLITSGGRPADAAPALDRALAASLGSSGLALTALDLTEGQVSGMGALRNAGLAAARALPGTVDATPIACLDADCVLGSRWLARLAAAFAAGHSFVVSPMLYLPFGTEPAVAATFFNHHFPLLLDEVTSLLAGAATGRLGGPQLAATSAAWSTIGDFPDVADGEDFAAGRELARTCGAFFLARPDALVFTADRAYAGGHEAGARLAGLRDGMAAEHGQTIEYENPLLPLLAALAEAGPGEPAILLDRVLDTLAPGLRFAPGQRSLRAVYETAAAAGIPRTIVSAHAVVEAVDGLLAVLGIVEDGHGTRAATSLAHHITALELALARCHAGPDQPPPGAYWPAADAPRAYAALAAAWLALLAQGNES